VDRIEAEFVGPDAVWLSFFRTDEYAEWIYKSEFPGERLSSHK